MTDDARPIVETAAGAVRGIAEGGVARFLGIPFAEPPFGANRFRAPVPRAGWTGVRNADRYGPTPQTRPFSDDSTIPEPSIAGDDVLSVNVFAPAWSGRRLPVLVWFHGGGWIAGSPASPWYDGTAFVRDGVVVVTVAYRVGFEGFGVLPDAPDNRALLDQVLALRWVRRNIDRFGGDPARVTIAGQSAGGGAVLALLASPPAAGLFAAAAAFSPSVGEVSRPTATARTARIAAGVGVRPDAGGLGSVSSAAIVATERNEDLGVGEGDGSALGTVRAFGVGTGFGPVVGDATVPARVIDAIRAGAGATTPLLAGAARDEVSSALLGHRQALDGADTVALLTAAGLDAGTAAAYAAAVAAGAADVLGRLVTDRLFRRPLVELLDARRGAPTWAYDFAWRGGPSGLAQHCLELPFLFDVLDHPAAVRFAGAEAPRSLASRVHGALVSFVREHRPGWAPADEGTVEVFDDGEPDPADDFASARVLAHLRSS